MASKVAAGIVFFSALTAACLAGQANTPSRDCDRVEQVEETSGGSSGRQFIATSCGGVDGKGVVEVRIFSNGKLAQKLLSPYDSSAYAVLLDTSIDIDSDGTPDLALATGAGRGGDGMRYWRYDSISGMYVDAGEAPFLTRCENSELDKFYSIASAGGGLHSIRTEYIFSDGRIAPVSAIGLGAAPDSNTYRVVRLAEDALGYFSIEKEEKIIPSASVDSYMDDTCLWPDFSDGEQQAVHGRIQS